MAVSKLINDRLIAGCDNYIRPRRLNSLKGIYIRWNIVRVGWREREGRFKFGENVWLQNVKRRLRVITFVNGYTSRACSKSNIVWMEITILLMNVSSLWKVCQVGYFIDVNFDSRATRSPSSLVVARRRYFSNEKSEICFPADNIPRMERMKTRGIKRYF